MSRRRMDRVLGALVPIALSAVLLTSCGSGMPSYGEVGSRAPEYGAKTVDGDSITLASLEGAPVLLTIWATCCPPCRKEMPDLQELHERYSPAGLQGVGVSIDARHTEARAVDSAE